MLYVNCYRLKPKHNLCRLEKIKILKIFKIFDHVFVVYKIVQKFLEIKYDEFCDHFVVF